jgi:hypothetical protein
MGKLLQPESSINSAVNALFGGLGPRPSPRRNSMFPTEHYPIYYQAQPTGDKCRSPHPSVAVARLARPADPSILDLRTVRRNVGMGERPPFAVCAAAGRSQRTRSRYTRQRTEPEAGAKHAG